MKQLQYTLDQQKLKELSVNPGPFLDSDGITRFKVRLMNSDF